MTVSWYPIRMVDLIGSIIMIIFSFLCLKLVRRLKKRDSGNLVWTYLLWVCLALAGFAISRSAGHILNHVLFCMGKAGTWELIRPYSGAVNTFMFMVVASVTLYFERSWCVYQEISRDKQALQAAHKELLYMNQNLESLVASRSKELVLSEQKYRRIFEVTRDLIMVAKTNGVIIDINPAGCQMLGYKDRKSFPDDKNIQDFFQGPEDWRTIYEKLKKQGFTSNDEADLVCCDGSVMRSLISTSVDKGLVEQEDTIHFLVKDIEQRKLMEQQMAQADKLASIGQLSAGIAHEINNPLGIILGYTQLMMRQEKPETERYQDLKTIEKHVRNCKLIVEDLLNFARSSKPKQEAIRIQETVEDVLHFIQHHGDLNNIRIQKDFEPSLPSILADEKKIRQVLMNLIINARHAVGKSGTISISGRLDEAAGEMILKVSDTGCGIEKKDLSRIFDPFFTTKPTGEGTGLGLSVSYGIIRNHGGDIFVESEPGRGTTFTIILPMNHTI